MGALSFGAITINFQNLLFAVYSMAMLLIKLVIEYLIRVLFWLLGQLIRLEQKEKLDKVEILFVHIFDSCMQALDNTLRVLLSVRASTKRLEIHPVLLITLVLLLSILSFRAGRIFEEDKKDDQKMQLQTKLDKIQTDFNRSQAEIAEKDAKIKALRKDPEGNEVEIADLREDNVPSAPTRHDTPIPASPTESNESTKDVQNKEHQKELKAKKELEAKKADVTKSALEELHAPSTCYDTPIAASATQSHETLDVFSVATGKESMTTGVEENVLRKRTREKDNTDPNQHGD
jgi:hypothetical protein